MYASPAVGLATMRRCTHREFDAVCTCRQRADWDRLKIGTRARCRRKPEESGDIVVGDERRR
eukprot:scaffold50077_cov35-Tisochrysis_lutea.AAC.2